MAKKSGKAQRGGIQTKSIYPPSALCDRLEEIAKAENRSFNQQVLRFLQSSVRRYDTREAGKGELVGAGK